MIQGRIIFGRRAVPDNSTGRLRSKSRTILLSTDAMTLVGHGSASGWRPLVWFWCSVAAILVVGGIVLALLGRPPERVSRELRPAQPKTDVAALASSKSLSRPVRDVSAQPKMPVAEPVAPTPAPPRLAQLDQQPRGRAAPPPDAQPPAGIAQPEAPARGRTLIVLHPARLEGGGAIADRLAARAGIAADQVDVAAASDGRTEAAIRFYSEDDHAFARRLGRELAGMGYTWRLENYTRRAGASKDQAIEVWLPAR